LTDLNIAFTLIYSLQDTYEAKRKEFLADLQHNEEQMRQMFVNKVKETEAELKEKERQVSPTLHVQTTALSLVSSVVGSMSPVRGGLILGK